MRLLGNDGGHLALLKHHGGFAENKENKEPCHISTNNFLADHHGILFAFQPVF